MRRRRAHSSVRPASAREMVNYKRVVCEVAFLAAMVAVATAAPVDCHYDQRQNGTENYRLNIDGVVIAVAPADSLLAAVSDIDLSELLSFEDLDKPKPPAQVPHKPAIEPKPEDGKPDSESLSDVSMNNDIKGQKKEASSVLKHEKAQRLKNRLAHILMPLLRRNRHH